MAKPGTAWLQSLGQPMRSWRTAVVTLGGRLTTVAELGHSLWIGVVLQIVSNLGYILLVDSRPQLALLTRAMAFENLTQVLRTSAFVVLLGRLT